MAFSGGDDVGMTDGGGGGDGLCVWFEMQK